MQGAQRVEPGQLRFELGVERRSEAALVFAAGVLSNPPGLGDGRWHSTQAGLKVRAARAGLSLACNHGIKGGLLVFGAAITHVPRHDLSAVRQIGPRQNHLGSVAARRPSEARLLLETAIGFAATDGAR